MAFVPGALSTQFAEIKTRQDYSHIHDLKFPADKAKIAALSLQEKQVWYSRQDPIELIEFDANTRRAGAAAEFDEKDYAERSDFRRWWFWHYLVPLRMKRLAYRFKFW